MSYYKFKNKQIDYCFFCFFILTCAPITAIAFENSNITQYILTNKHEILAHDYY